VSGSFLLAGYYTGLKQKKWVGYPTSVATVGSHNLVPERPFQGVTTEEKAVSEHEPAHLSNMHCARCSLCVGDMDLAIHGHQKTTGIPHEMPPTYLWRCVGRQGT